MQESRRQLLKGLGGCAVLMTPFVQVAEALTLAASSKEISGSSLPICDLTIYKQQSGAKESVSLMNLTDSPVKLDSINPVNLEHVNGSLVVRLNQVPEGSITLQAGERLSFEIEAISSDKHEGTIVPNVLAGHVRVNSDHPAFNGIIPVTVFDGQVA